jgi:hypothetical protein
MSDMPTFEMPENEEEFSQLWEEAQNVLGCNDMNMNRDRPYSGQPHTDLGVRGSHEIKGITFRDLRDCFVRAVVLSTPNAIVGGEDLVIEAEKGPAASICSNDLYRLEEDIDIMALCQNLVCEVERIMGIFPNVPPLKFESED